MATASLPPGTGDPTPGPDLSESMYEVIDGVVVEKPPMGAYEYELAFLLGMEIDRFTRPRGVGRAVVEMIFDFRPQVDRQRRPDVAFLSVARCPLGRWAPQEGAWRIVPDIAIEIVSPTNSAVEVIEKIDEYFRVGVSRVWVVYPRAPRIYVYEAPGSMRLFQKGDTLVDEAILPGFRLDLDAFFGQAE